MRFACKDWTMHVRGSHPGLQTSASAANSFTRSLVHIHTQVQTSKTASPHQHLPCLEQSTITMARRELGLTALRGRDLTNSGN